MKTGQDRFYQALFFFTSGLIDALFFCQGGNGSITHRKSVLCFVREPPLHTCNMLLHVLTDVCTNACMCLRQGHQKGANGELRTI